jgi:ribonuclease HI
LTASPIEQLTIYTDGAARGNPGPAGAGAFLTGPDGETVDEVTEYLGEATNNVAEYRALVLGLERARDLGARRVEIRADSELVVKQMLGEYRVRNADLRVIFRRAKALESEFDSVDYVHVRREKNRDADRLANLAIDSADAS